MADKVEEMSEPEAPTSDIEAPEEEDTITTHFDQGPLMSVREDVNPDTAISVAEKAFKGDYTLLSISDGIRKQFGTYMNLDDTTNYVEIFYDQLVASYRMLVMDESSETPMETKEVLEAINAAFMSMMAALIEKHLGLGINGYDDGHLSTEDFHYIVSRVYEYFILNARRNFKVAITTNLNAMLDLKSETYFQDVQDQLAQYSPLITTMTPMEFLTFTGNREMIDMYTENKIVGNFLLKYSPKLFSKETDEFVPELINYITSHQQLGEEFKKQFGDNPPEIGE